MTRTVSSQCRLKKIFALSLVAMLAACGGGGAKKSSQVADTTPDAFSFVAQTDVARSASVTSAAVTISGINTETSISILDAEYSINGGAFTSAVGTVRNGQSVTIRITASSALATKKTATLIVGGVVAGFSVTTLTDTTAPSAKIMFPSPVSTTEGDSVLVRGTASDSTSPITEVKVNNIRAETVDNYANWQVRVPLVSGVNSLSVSTRDNAGNTATAASASITSTVLLKGPQGMLLDSARGRILVFDSYNDEITAVDLTTGARSKFSDSSDTQIKLERFRGAILDEAHNRIVIANTWYSGFITIDLTSGARSLLGNRYSVDAITADIANNRALFLSNDSLEILDLASGNNTALSNHSVPDAVNAFVSPIAVTLDTNNHRALVVDQGLKAIVAVNLTTGARSIMSNYSASNAVNPLLGPKAMAMDASRNRVLIADSDYYDSGRVAIMAVDLATGARTVLSDNTTPGVNNRLRNLTDLILDQANNRLLVTLTDPSEVMAIDLTTGKHSAVSQVSAPDASNPFSDPDEILLDIPRNRALVADYGLNAIVAVDVNTGVRTLFSSSAVPNPTNAFTALGRIALDAGNNRVLAADGTSLIAVSFSNGARTIISSNTIPNAENTFSSIDGITVDAEHDRALVTDNIRKAVIAVNLTTGARTIFSDNTVPNSATPFVNIGGISLDPAHNRALILDVFDPGQDSALVALDLSSGARTVISNRSISDSYYHSGHAITLSAEQNRALITDDGCCGDYRVAYSLNLSNGSELKSIGESDSDINALSSPRGIAWDADHNCALITDNSLNAVILVDLVTLERVYLSK